VGCLGGFAGGAGVLPVGRFDVGVPPGGFTGGGRTGTTTGWAVGTTGGALGDADALGAAVSSGAALGACAEAAGTALSIPTTGADCADSPGLLLRSTTMTRIASTTPTTDPTTIPDTRRCFCSAAAWLVLAGSAPLGCIKPAIEETGESPVPAAGGGGAGGGAICALSASRFRIRSEVSGDIRIVPCFVTIGSAQSEPGSSFAVVGAGPVQPGALPNDGALWKGNVDLKLGGAGADSC